MILTSCGSSNKYTHKNSTIEKKETTYKVNKLFFTIVEATLNQSEQGSSFITNWTLNNTSEKPQKIRLVENTNETYLIYGKHSKKIPLYGIGIGTCEGKGDCYNYIKILPNQKLTFILKSPVVNFQDLDEVKIITANLRTHFEIKEENYYTYPIDMEFNNLTFNTDNWIHDYGKKQ